MLRTLGLSAMAVLVTSASLFAGHTTDWRERQFVEVINDTRDTITITGKAYGGDSFKETVRPNNYHRIRNETTENGHLVVKLADSRGRTVTAELTGSKQHGNMFHGYRIVVGPADFQRGGRITATRVSDLNRLYKLVGADKDPKHALVVRFRHAIGSKNFSITYNSDEGPETLRGVIRSSGENTWLDLFIADDQPSRFVFTPTEHQATIAQGDEVTILNIRPGRYQNWLSISTIKRK